MLKCEKCGKCKVYICSDNRNAWCQDGCGNYAYFDGIIFYLGKDIGSYPVREDGSIRKIKRKEEGNIITTEEERLLELENKFKELIKEKKDFNEKYWKSSDWWSNLSKENKIKIWESNNYDI